MYYNLSYRGEDAWIVPFYSHLSNRLISLQLVKIRTTQVYYSVDFNFLEHHFLVKTIECFLCKTSELLLVQMCVATLWLQNHVCADQSRFAFLLSISVQYASCDRNNTDGKNNNNKKEIMCLVFIYK